MKKATKNTKPTRHRRVDVLRAARTMTRSGLRDVDAGTYTVTPALPGARRAFISLAVARLLDDETDYFDAVCDLIIDQVRVAQAARR